MSDIQIEKGRISSDTRKHGRRASSVRPTTKKLPVSETQPTPSSANLDEVAFIRLPEVKAVTGLSKTSIYELIRASDFPSPIRLGPRSVAWIKAEIREWAVERVHASRSAA